MRRCQPVANSVDKKLSYRRGTARCYASAVLAMALSVRPSQVGVLLKRLNEWSWFLARELQHDFVARVN